MIFHPGAFSFIQAITQDGRFWRNSMQNFNFDIAKDSNLR